MTGLSSDRLSRYIPVVQLFAARLVLFHQRIADRLGLTATEFKCFRLVEQLGPMSLIALVQETGLKAGTVSVLVEQLVAKAFLLRECDCEDRRRVVLTARPEAAERTAELYRDQGEAMARLFTEYNEQDFQLILSFLEAVSASLQHHRTAVEDPAIS